MKTFAETERLILRELVMADDQGMFELDSDPEVHKYLGNEPVKTIEQSRDAINFIRKQYEDNGIGRWAVIEKQSGKFIGWAGLKLIKEPVNGHINIHDVGYRFIKQAWGKGYATEAAKACINYGFNTLGLTEIYGFANLDNEASKAVLQKCGLVYRNNFTFVGIEHAWYEIKSVAFNQLKIKN